MPELLLTYDSVPRTFRSGGMPVALRLADSTSRRTITWGDAICVGRGLPLGARIGAGPTVLVARSLALAGASAETIAELASLTIGADAALTGHASIHAVTARALCAAVAPAVGDPHMAETLQRFAAHSETDLDAAVAYATQRIDDGEATALDRHLSPVVDEQTVAAAQLILDVVEAERSPGYWGSAKRLAPLLRGRIEVQRAVINVLAATPRLSSEEAVR